MESNETVELTLETGTGYTVGTTAAVVGTITNDDIAPSPPTISSIGGTDNIASSAANDNRVVGTAAAGSTVSLRSGTNTLGTAVANSSGAFSYALTPANITTLAQGTGKSITATASDSAGNTSAASASFTFGIFTGTNSVISATSATLSSSKDTLILTGNRNTWGSGNSSNNTIIGNPGDNRLAGGEGKDNLTGNEGADSFVYNRLSDSLLGTGGATGSYDVITDFSPRDRIIATFDLGRPWKTQADCARIGV